MDEPTRESDDDIESWLRVLHTPRLKSRLLRQLLDHFGHPARLLDAGRDTLQCLLGPSGDFVHRRLHAGEGCAIVCERAPRARHRSSSSRHRMYRPMDVAPQACSPM